jgi:hypothetical protein
MREAKHIELAQKILERDDVKAGCVFIYDGKGAMTAMGGEVVEIISLLGNALNKLSQQTGVKRETIYGAVIEAANLKAGEDEYPTWDIEGD